MATAFESLLKGELKALEHDLLKDVNDGRLSAHDVQDILSFFPDLHFPGLITLLALGTTANNQKKGTTPFSLTKRNIADALARLSAKDEHAKQAARLLLTGQFFGDMADAFATIFHVVPGIPLDLAQDFSTLPHLPRRLVLAITRDLGDAPSAVKRVMTELRTDGKINSRHKILSRTMGALYRQATARQIAATLHSLLGNESVRLAIIVFAKSKGVTITQKDLDHVRKAINPQKPDLGELLAPGYQHLRERFGTDQAIEILDGFVV
jgi:hypothetical protein